MGRNRLFRGAGGGTALALAGTVLAAAPADASSVEWAPLPGGHEALRLTGPGLGTKAPTQPAFTGRTFTFIGTKGASAAPRVFTLKPGRDLPTEVAAPPGLRQPTSRLSTPHGLFTTTATPGGTRVHRVTGTTSQVVATLGTTATLRGHVGTRLFLGTFDAKWMHVDPTAAPGDQVWDHGANLSAATVTPAGFYYSLPHEGTQQWRRVTATGDHTIAVGTPGASGPAGVGAIHAVMPFRDGVVVSAAHQVHGNELWFLPPNNSAPHLLTNVNDSGTTAPITLLGELDNRFWFEVGGSVKKVFSSGGTLGDERVEMSHNHPDYSIYASRRIGSAFLSWTAAGVQTYRYGMAAPSLLLPGAVGSFAASPDGQRLLVSSHPTPSTVRWYATNGTTAGTRPLQVFQPGGYLRPLTSAASTLVAGPGTTVGYQLTRGANLEQFITRPDRTVRLLAVKAKATQRVNRATIAVKVAVRAGEKVTSTATGSIRVPGMAPIRFTTTRLTSKKDRSRTLTVRVPKAKRAAVVRALQQKQTVRATVKVVVRDANAGNKVTRTVKVRLV